MAEVVDKPRGIIDRGSQITDHSFLFFFAETDTDCGVSKREIKGEIKIVN